MSELRRPSGLNIETSSDDFGRFSAHPFERGYGVTIGNALRRLLISSIQGAAVTAVKFDGVQHEMSTIPGVKEDTLDIILNIKRIPPAAPWGAAEDHPAQGEEDRSPDLGRHRDGPQCRDPGS